MEKGKADHSADGPDAAGKTHIQPTDIRTNAFNRRRMSLGGGGYSITGGREAAISPFVCWLERDISHHNDRCHHHYPQNRDKKKLRSRK